MRPAWQRHLPNALTFGRLALAVVFIAMLTPWRYDPQRLPDALPLAAAVVFAIAAFTDALDGHLARRWQVVSVFGRVMDPFADKLLVLGGFVVLAGPAFRTTITSAGLAAGTDGAVGATGATLTLHASAVQPWMVVVILGRELLITSLRGAMESRGVDFSATASGKMKMALQSVCIPAVLVVLGTLPLVRAGGGGLSTTGAYTLVQALVWSTVLVSAWSGVPYVLRALKVRFSSQ